MGKPLAPISTLHSRKAFPLISDRAKVIMQFFTTIELCSGDMTIINAIGTQRDFEAKLAIAQLIDKGKQFW